MEFYARANVRALNQHGYEAQCLPIEALDHNACYSVINLADVLEHKSFPNVGLAAAHRLLRRDGVLFHSMPNIDNMVWRLPRVSAK
jgi:2-polyprenyl-3-methyl-5-hydroxy-6-metoxy-1,4-benzoquinol methylase